MIDDLTQAITHLKDINNYDGETFEMDIRLTVSHSVSVNYSLKEEGEEQADYIKRYLLNNYFPECFSLKVLEHQLDRSTWTYSFWLQCKIEVNTSEYKMCVKKYIDHFVLNPKWRVAELKPLDTRWHE